MHIENKNVYWYENIQKLDCLYSLKIVIERPSTMSYPIKNLEELLFLLKITKQITKIRLRMPT